MQNGDKVRITKDNYKSKLGRVKSRYLTIVPKEWEKVKQEVVFPTRNETLYGVRLDEEKKIVYLPESSPARRIRMKSKSPENGLEELKRLSDQISRTSREQANKDQQNTERRRAVQDIRQGLKEINFTVALDQLKRIATPEMIKEVSSLAREHDTRRLRKLVLSLAADLEKGLDSKSSSKLDMVTIERSAKTLPILIELLFSIE
jgi:hypothetical protein